ncbi:MAG TPA: HEAT repeat domain-containing protein [Steroidobacteraceae bacterium]|nr:HEAT repeat domain-containing protein [Steroidobacteraceae bacterium]
MELEQTLKVALAPREPAADFEETVMARVSAAAWRASRASRRRPGRAVLAATILVVAAAAAMLATQLRHSRAPIKVARIAPAVSQPTAAVAGPPRASASIEPVAHAGKVETKETAPPVKPFTVRVLPLQNEAADTMSRSAVASMYAAFLDHLRVVPGATLLEADTAGNAPDGPADFRITIRTVKGKTTKGAGQAGKFDVELQADTLRPDGTLRSGFYTSSTGEVAASCGVDLSSCANPEGVAVGFVRVLRNAVFPPDPALRRQLQTRLLDRSLGVLQRLRALSDLALLGRSYSVNTNGSAPGAPAAALRDPVVVRGAVDLAAAATDPAMRAQIWATLQGVGSAELIQPLLDALRQDSDGEVRLAALGALVASFGDDPRVHAALETTAQLDAWPLLRALAQRALGGANAAAAWGQYIQSSLEDTSRPAIERIEALFHQLNLPTTNAFASGANSPDPLRTLRLLDSDGIRALTQALPAAATESSIVQRSTPTLVSALQYVDNPAITDMLLASLDDDGQWLDRSSATAGLVALASRRNDPRVRAVLERLSTSDPDPQLRQIAAGSLQPPANTSAEQPPRLGVATTLMEAGPSAPQELVGKPVVMRVLPDSVAEEAGLMEGDVLLEINNAGFSSAAEMITVLDAVPRGVDVDVVVYRSGEKLTLKARF